MNASSLVARLFLALLPVTVLLSVTVLPADAAGDAAIPAHPRLLRYEPLLFSVPNAAAYRHQLDNGVVVFLATDHTLPLIDVTVAVRAGDHLDPEQKVGLAGLTGALLRRGGTARLDADAFDLAVDTLGAEISAQNGASRAGASLSCTTFTFDEALTLFFDMLRTPRFQKDRLDLVKASLRESMQGRNDDLLAILEREWGWLINGPDHFTARYLTPTRLDTLDREDLVAFHRRYWQPANMVIAVSGDIEAKALLPALEGHFEGWQAGTHAPWPPSPPAHTLRPGLYRVESNTPQAKVTLGHLGYQRTNWDDPQAFALIVLDAILGSASSGRIAGRLRSVEGLVYRADAYFGVGDFSPGALQVFFETEGKNVPRALRLARGELERLRTQPVGKAELEHVKRSLIDPFPQLFDSAQEIAGYFAEDVYLGRPHTFWRTYRQRIEAVSAADVQAVARRHLHPAALVTLIVGPWEQVIAGEGGRILQELGMDEATILPPRDPLTLAPLTPAGGAKRGDGTSAPQPSPFLP